MIDDVALSVLIDHFYNYTEFCHLNVERFEIEELLVDWLTCIEAPNNARGVGVVFGTIYDFSQDASVRHKLESFFKLPSWFISALAYRLSCDDSGILADIYDKTMGKGWCESIPFYAWLFSAAHFANDNKSRSVQMLFIEQYYLRLSELQDVGLSTSSKTREQEVCGAARLLFDRKNIDMLKFIERLDAESLSHAERLAKEIDDYFKSDAKYVEQKNINYLRSIKHFFLSDWASSMRHHRANQFRKRVARRYNKTVKYPIQGNDYELQELLPALSEVIDTDGLNQDDLYPLQIYVQEDSSCEQVRDTKETISPERVFDKKLQYKKTIDVTAKVRRGQNVSLQNTELLKGAELAGFIRYLQRLSMHQSDEKREFAIVFWCMLLLGKDPHDISELTVFDDELEAYDGLLIDSAGRGWWCFPIRYSAKPKLGDVSLGLEVTNSRVYTSCPAFLVNLISKGYAGGRQSLLSNNLNSNDFQKRLKHYSNRLIEGGRVSCDNLSNFLHRYCFASGCIDPVVLDLSYNLPLTQTRVSRSYACLEDNERLAAIERLWTDIRDYVLAADNSITLPKLFEPTPWHKPQFVGSIFTPTQEACCKLTSTLKHRLVEHSPPSVFPLDNVLNYHNSYAIYTAFLLYFATGYRAVHNPLPALALYLREYGLLGISDKDDSDFTHARFVCVPPTLGQQLTYYQAHLNRLAELIRYRTPELSREIDFVLWQDERLLALSLSDAAIWYQTVKNSRKVLGPLLVFRKMNHQWQAYNLSPKVLLSEQPPGLQLPANAGRHWMKTGLIKRCVEPEWIDWQMGHWMTGQAPLGYYSALNHVEVGAQLAPVLEGMLSEVGWQSIPSKLI